MQNCFHTPHFHISQIVTINIIKSISDPIKTNNSLKIPILQNDNLFSIIPKLKPTYFREQIF